MDLLENAVQSIQVGVEDYGIGSSPRLLPAARIIAFAPVSTSWDLSRSAQISAVLQRRWNSSLRLGVLKEVRRWSTRQSQFL